MLLTQIINGEVSELALCQACAKERGLFDPQSLTFAEKFFPAELKSKVEEIVHEIESEMKPQESAAAAQFPTRDLLTRCPQCSFSLEDYRKTLSLGCPECYRTFAREIESDAHEMTARPSSSLAAQTAGEADEETEPKEEPRISTATRLKQLEAALKHAIGCEDYEAAAHLRDEITRLKGSNEA